MYLISTSIIFIIFLFYYYYHVNKNIEILDIDQYKIDIKPQLKPTDKFNIKEYGVINENIIIHNKYKKELEGLRKSKYIIDQKNQIETQKILNKRNKEINKNSKKIKLRYLREKIDLLTNSINSLNISFKLELNKFLADIKQKLVTQNDLNYIISKLAKQLIENNKLIEKTQNTINNLYNPSTKTNINENDINKNDPEYAMYLQSLEEYLSLLNIKNSIIHKKLNVYMKFIKK